MTSATRDAYFYQFDVMLRYYCPECGEPRTRYLDAWEVHMLLDGLLDVECAKCGEKLRVEVRDD